MSTLNAMANQADITDTWSELQPGIMHLHREIKNPNRSMNAIQIDLQKASVSFRASQKSDAALTPRQFADKVGAYIAINADFFDVNHGYLPLGPAVGQGVHWPRTPYFTNWFMMGCVDLDCTIQKYPGEVDPAWTNVIGGRDLIVTNGVPWTASDDKRCGSLCTIDAPRTVIGLDASRNILTLLVVDGYAEETGGLPVSAAAQILAELGVSEGLHLDGGGSSQLVIDGKLISKRPRTEPLERPVGNSFGILRGHPPRTP